MAETPARTTKSTRIETADENPNVSLLANEANPTGKPDVSTGDVGDREVIDGQEHVLGDDPRRVAGQLEGGFHDSQSGRPCDAEGRYTDSMANDDDVRVAADRIVANDWVGQRENINDKSKRKGNTAPSA